MRSRKRRKWYADEKRQIPPPQENNTGMGARLKSPETNRRTANTNSDNDGLWTVYGRASASPTPRQRPKAGTREAGVEALAVERRAIAVK